MKTPTPKQSRRGWKKEYELAMKTSVSMPRFLYDRGVDKARARGIFGFSDYVQDLIRRDTQATA